MFFGLKLFTIQFAKINSLNFEICSMRKFHNKNMFKPPMRIFYN